MLFLTLVDAGLPRVHNLHEGDTVIGRSTACDLIINSPQLSRQHARVRIAGGKVILQDLGSTAGTFVNNAKITGDHELHSGDSFEVAQIAITLGGHLPHVDLTEDGHQLVDEGHSIVMSVVPPPVPSAAGSDAPSTERRILRLLTEVGKTLIQVRPLDQVLDRVVQLVFDVVPAERVFLLLRDALDQPLTARVMRNRDGTRPAKTTLSRTIVNKVMRERVAMLARDAVYDARLHASASVQSMNVRSFMCAPLWNRDDVMGVLYCDNPNRRIFHEQDLEVFAALCNYAAVAIEQARLTEQLTAETRRRERLQRYHSPSVTNKILHDADDDGGLVAQPRDVSVMFCDIAGFTPLTQHMAPAAVGALLNEFFERMTEAIFDHDGTLDKFIGDAILAIFGAPLEQPDHAGRAVGAALAMRRALARLNEENPERPIRMRIAINSGEALIGDIGSRRRREFTVIGDVVNTASRIESSVAQPGQIVISRSTKDLLGPQFESRQLESVTLRGRDGALEVFEVID